MATAAVFQALSSVFNNLEVAHGRLFVCCVTCDGVVLMKKPSTDNAVRAKNHLLLTVCGECDTPVLPVVSTGLRLNLDMIRGWKLYTAIHRWCGGEQPNCTMTIFPRDAVFKNHGYDLVMKSMEITQEWEGLDLLQELPHMRMQFL